MVKTISNKKYFCSLCDRERKGNIDRKKEIICWWCVYRLMAYPKDFVYKQYKKAVALGMEKKA